MVRIKVRVRIRVQVRGRDRVQVRGRDRVQVLGAFARGTKMILPVPPSFSGSVTAFGFCFVSLGFLRLLLLLLLAGKESSGFPLLLASKEFSVAMVGDTSKESLLVPLELFAF